MPVPACGNGHACGGALSEAEANPRARRNLLEGGVNPRARRNLLEGAFEWAALVGRGDLRSVGRAPRVCLSGMCLVWFFAVFKQDSPGCFRRPSGLSLTASAANYGGYGGNANKDKRGWCPRWRRAPKARTTSSSTRGSGGKGST
jgi:hypothetical protein